MYNVKEENFRDRALRKLIAFLVAAAFLIPLMTPESFAASSVSIAGGDSVKGGETFTVTVKYSGNVGSVRGEMTYDTSKLTYISGGSSTGNTGNIQLKDDLSSNGTITFNIKFQAVSEGNTQLNVSTIEMYDMDYNYLDNPSTSKSVNIIGTAADEELVKEPRDSETPAEEVELYGVDEKEDSGVNTNVVLMVSAGILAVIIAVIAVVLMRKRHKK